MKQVYRYFIIRHFEERSSGVKESFDALLIQSSFEGEFGSVVLQSVIDINGSPYNVSCYFSQTSGERPESLYAFRTHEIAYIFTHIVPLFNPLNLLKDEIPQESPAQNAQ